MHLPERERAIDNMLRALRPGGTLVLEDIIIPNGITWPELPAWRKVIEAATTAFHSVGADPYYGIKLPSALGRRGAVAPRFEVRAPVATATDDFYRLCLDQLRPVLLRLGAVDQAELRAVYDALQSPERVFLAPLMAAAWVTRPVLENASD